MAQYSTEAILLLARNWGEADKIITFFSRDLGKIRAIAYGCRRPKSPLAGGMQVFSQLRLQVTEGGQLDTIKQCETELSFKELREDLNCMAYAAFLVEFAAEICPEQHPEPEVYDILLAAFHLFPKRNPRLVALAAVFQLLECTGSQPDYLNCALCHTPIAGDAAFAAERGGAVCSACAATGMAPFSAALRGFIGQLLALNWQQPASFTINGAVLVQAEKLLLNYLLSILEKPLKSLAFINQLALLPKAKET